MAKDKKGGYGNPPPDHRFKPGQSGNPKGRPKGQVSFSSMVQDIFLRKVTVTTGQGSERVFLIQALLLRLSDIAMKGNVEATQVLLNLAPVVAGGHEDEHPSSADDNDILEAFARSILGRQQRRRKSDE